MEQPKCRVNVPISITGKFLHAGSINIFERVNRKVNNLPVNSRWANRALRSFSVCRHWKLDIFRCIALCIRLWEWRGGDKVEREAQSHSRRRTVLCCGNFEKVKTRFFCDFFGSIFFLEKMKLVVFWCVLFGFLGILNAATLERGGKNIF